MRLRDLPGLASTLEKIGEQARRYAGMVKGDGKPGNPYAPKKKRKKLKWE